MKSNFAFLEEYFPVLQKLGASAENYLYSDADSSLYKLGKLGETIVNEMMRLDGIQPPETDNTHANRIKILKREGLIPKDVDDILYSLR